MTRRHRLLDAAVLALLVLAALLSALTLPGATPGHRLLAGVLLVAQCGLALGRRRAPTATFLVCAGCAVLDAVLVETLPVWTWMVLAFGVALRAGRRRDLVVLGAGTAATLVAAAVLVEVVPAPGDRDSGDPADVPGTAAGLAVIVVPLLAAAVVAGLLVRRRRAQLAVLRAQQEQERTAGVLVAERERIAADLSALVAARVTALLALVRALPDAGEGAAAGLVRVGDEARAALAGMRRALGLLRADPPDPARPPGHPASSPHVRAAPRGRVRVAPTASGLGLAALVAAGVAGTAVAVAALAPPGDRTGLLAMLDVDPARPLTWFPLAVQLLALGWWRRAPLAALVAASVGSAAAQLLDSVHLGTEISWFVLVHAAATGAAPRASGTTLLACSVVVSTATVVSGALARLGAPALSPSAIVLSYAFAASLWGLGVAQRRARLAQDRARRVRALDREMRATRAQRLGLARELHDLLAHELSALVVTTNAARVSGADASAVATVRAAVTRIDRVLPQLTGRPGDPDAPAAGTLDAGSVDAGSIDAAGLEALVGPARAAGLPVEVLAPAQDEVPGDPLVTLFARRILTEALTNVLRHAGCARTRVVVAPDGDAVLVEVTDAGATPGHRAPETAGGLGLVGMRERATLLGGTLDAGPVGPAGEGWRVRARLPRPGLPRAEEERVPISSPERTPRAGVVP